MSHEISQEEAIEAGKVCGALLFGYLWSFQHDSAGPVTLPIRQKSSRKYLTTNQACDALGVGRTKFYEYKDDPDFPAPHPVTKKYLASEIDRYDKKLKSKKA